MLNLPPATIRALIDAAIACDLARGDRRDMLFTGLPRSIVARIAEKAVPADQIAVDIAALAELQGQPEAAGVRPLVVWLSNARQYAGPRPERAVFEEALRVLDELHQAELVTLRRSHRMTRPIPATDTAFDRRLDERPILWVGAGLSVGAGYPSTWTLVESLRTRAEPGDIPVGLDDFTAVVDAFIKAEGQGALHDIIDDEFAHPRRPTAVHAAIARLAAAGTFARIVTTNYDPLIETALREAGVVFNPRLLDGNSHLQPKSNKLEVIKIHGDQSNWKDVIFSRSSYDSFAERYRFLVQQLDIWMTQHPILFAGCSMQDPRILDWLRTVPVERRELLKPWRPMMTAQDWEAAWDLSPDALSVGNIRPLIVDDYRTHLTQLWANAADRRAPRLDWLDLDLTVDARGWSATLGAHRWRIEHPVAGPEGAPAHSDLTERIAALRDIGNRPLPTDAHGAPVPAVSGTAAHLRALAREVGDQLTDALFSPAARDHVARAIAIGTAHGDATAPPCLRLRVRPATPNDTARADHALALPWELLRIDERFPVEDGALDVAREAVIDDAASPGPPDQPLTVVATVAAPVDANPLDHEDECYRLLTALGDEDRRLLLTDRGTLDDMIDAVVDHRPAVLHFTGHGGPGKLLFEDDAARGHVVEIDTLIALLRQRRRAPLPRLMFVAACHGASTRPGAPSPHGTRDDDLPSETRQVDAAEKGPRTTDPRAFQPGASVAASLNRAGFANVVGYFGPVGDAQSTRIEAAFYAALVAGESARVAVRRGRAVASRPHGTAGRHTQIYPLGWAQLALYHRGVDQPVATTQENAPADIHRRGRRRVEVRFDRARQTADGVVHLRHGFIGRRSPRATLIRHWLDGRRLQVVHGLGGLGKTALCGEVAPILARRMGGVPLLALDGTAARGKVNPIAALWAELSLFDPKREWNRDGWEDSLAELQGDGLTGRGLARAILDVSGRCDGLLVYLDDAESLLATDGDVRRWVDSEVRVFWEMLCAACEPDGRFGLLASSRYVPAHTPDRALVPLPPMRLADTMRLIRWTPTIGRVPFQDAEWLAERIDGHPRTVHWLDGLVERKARAYARLHIGPHAEYSGDGWRKDVLEPALEGVSARVDADLLLPKLYDALAPPAQALLGACTVLGRPVPWGAVVELGDAESAATLVETGLLSPDLTPELEARETWWAPHRLVRDAIRPLWEGDPADAHRVVGRWLAAAHDKEPSASLALPAIDHLLAAREVDTAWPLTEALVLSLRRHGRRAEALDLVQRVLAADPRGAVLASALTYRVNLSHPIGIPVADPEADLRQARELADAKTLPFVLGETGKLLQRQGRLREARAVLEERISEMRGENQHTTTPGITLALLADIERSLGNYPRALTLFREALDDLTTGLGTDVHPEVANALTGMGQLLFVSGDLDGAQSAIERTLVILRSLFPTDEHPQVINALVSVGHIKNAKGAYAEAASSFERAGELHVLLHGHLATPGGVQILAGLGGAYRRAGELARAEAAAREALRLQVALLDTEEHPEVAKTKSNLAGILVQRGRYEEACHLYSEGLAIFSRLFPSSAHAETGLMYHGLSQALLGAKRPEEALQAVERAIEVKWLNFQAEPHPSVARSLHQRALIYSTLGHQAKAIESCSQALEVRFNVHGTRRHPESAETLELLGELFINDETGAQQDWIRGALLIRDAASTYKSMLGPDHPNTKRAEARMADFAQWAPPYPLLFQEGVAAVWSADPEGGARKLEAFIEGAKGSSYPHVVASARGLLGELYMDAGRHDEARHHLELTLAAAQRYGQADVAVHVETILAQLR